MIAVMHCQRLAGEAAPVTGRAAHFHVRQEMHLDRQHAGAFAALAAPARDVEREVPGGQPEAASFGGGGKRFADGGKRIRIGRGVRARDAPDVLLVDGDDLVEVFVAFDRVVLAGGFAGTIQALADGAVEDVEHQRGFSGPGYTRHGHQQAQRQAHGEVLKVVLAGAVDGNGFVAWRAAARRDGDGSPPGQVISGERPGLPGHFSRCTGRHHLPAVLAGAWAKVDHGNRRRRSFPGRVR